MIFLEISCCPKACRSDEYIDLDTSYQGVPNQKHPFHEHPFHGRVYKKIRGASVHATKHLLRFCMIDRSTQVQSVMHTPAPYPTPPYPNLVLLFYSQTTARPLSLLTANPHPQLLPAVTKPQSSLPPPGPTPRQPAQKAADIATPHSHCTSSCLNPLGSGAFFPLLPSNVALSKLSSNGPFVLTCLFAAAATAALCCP